MSILPVQTYIEKDTAKTVLNKLRIHFMKNLFFKRLLIYIDKKKKSKEPFCNHFFQEYLVLLYFAVVLDAGGRMGMNPLNRILFPIKRRDLNHRN